MVRILCAAIAATFAVSAAHATQNRADAFADRPGSVARHPRKNTVDLMPKKIGGLDVTYIVLDDASDTTKAVTNTKKLITEDKVDVVIGSTTTPNAMAMIDVVAEGETPNISLGGSARIVDIANPKTKWVFKVSQHDSLMADAIAVHAKAAGISTMGFIDLQRCLRRRLAGGDASFSGYGGHQDGTRRAIQPYRCQHHGPGTETYRCQSAGNSYRGFGHTGRYAAQGINRPWL